VFRLICTLCSGLVCVAVTTACAASSGEHEGRTPDDIVARIGGEPITADELDQTIAGELFKLKQQVYEARQNGLQEMAFDRLVAAAAEAEELTVSEYLKKHVGDQVEEPAEEDIAEVLERYRQRLPADEEEARGKVVQFLRSQKETELRQALRQRLFAGGGLEVLLEPPRAEVAVEPFNPSRGPADAPVTLVEYTDFQCPYCSRVQPTLRQLLDRYPGLVRHVFRHLPLSMHRQARLAAEASLCAADQDKFWEMHHWMFANQRTIDRETIDAHAEELGFDMEAFAACIDNKTHAADVKVDLAAAASVGITGTPGFTINGRLLTGAQPYGEFAKVIEEELRLAGIPVPEPPPMPQSTADPKPEKAEKEAAAEEE
jgi:protein-disulfide isomerase